MKIGKNIVGLEILGNNNTVTIDSNEDVLKINGVENSVFIKTNLGIVSIFGGKNKITIEKNESYDIYDSGIMNDVMILDTNDYTSEEGAIDTDQLMFNFMNSNLIRDE